MIDPEDLDRVDPDFVEDLVASEEARQFVAGWLRARGWTLTAPEQRIRPDPKVRFLFSDPGDLVDCVRPDGSRPTPSPICEVKGRTESFTPETFPFPDGAFVGNVERVEKINPAGVAVVSADFRWIAFARAESRPRWTVARKWINGRWQEVYVAALADLFWYRGRP